jgi:hypothetical protein
MRLLKIFVFLEDQELPLTIPKLIVLLNEEMEGKLSKKNVRMGT